MNQQRFKQSSCVVFVLLGALLFTLAVFGIALHASPKNSALLQPMALDVATPRLVYVISGPVNIPSLVGQPLSTATPSPTPTATATPMPPTPRPVAVVASNSPYRSPPAVQGAGASYEALAALVASYGDWSYDEAMAVAMCESSGNSNAVSYAGAVGWFQIHPYNPANFDPATNVSEAHSKWLDGVLHGNRWAHWNLHGSCGHYF